MTCPALLFTPTPRGILTRLAPRRDIAVTRDFLKAAEAAYYAGRYDRALSLLKKAETHAAAAGNDLLARSIKELFGELHTWRDSMTLEYWLPIRNRVWEMAGVVE